MIGILRGLKTRLERLTKEYRLQADGLCRRRVTVYEQYVPPEAIEDCPEREGYYPLIAITFREFQDDVTERSGSRMDVGLTFGVYGEGKETWRDLLNLMTTVRMGLLREPVIEGKYRLLEIKGAAAEDQPVPFYIGEMECRYMMYRAEEEK